MNTTDGVSTVAERVAAGAAWLDENRPRWEDYIDLERLMLDDEEDCILGQLYGGFNEAPDELVTPGWRATHLGFDLMLPSPWNQFPDEYQYTPERMRELEAEWRRLIESRRAEVTP